jgi:hypothetical protein
MSAKQQGEALLLFVLFVKRCIIGSSSRRGQEDSIMQNKKRDRDGRQELFDQDVSLPGDDAEESESELAVLLDQTLADVTEGMNEEEATAYLATLFEGTEVGNEHILFAHVIPEMTATMAVTNYRPDQAMREASLAQKDQWKPTESGEVAYLASNALEVYLGTREHPLELPQALKHIRLLSESTILTARIVLGLWNTRRNNARVSKNGSVAILLDEILQWQGLQKHSRVAHPGTETTKRYTDGYRPEHKQRVIQDLGLLASCNVRGTCTITVRGKATPIEVDGPYLRYSTVSRKTSPEEKSIIGFLISPGDWITTYEQHHNYYLAEVDSRIFKLNPQNDRYALRLALYLTERWREQARQGDFSSPIVMAELLAASMIAVDERHLTVRFAPRITEALDQLEEMGIIGKHLCLSAIDQTQARWGKDWLASRWEILPPLDLIHAYTAIGKRARRRKS